MRAERDPLDELLASVLDGAPMDWDGAVRFAPPADRARVEVLRELARIAEFSRRQQRVPGDGGTRRDLDQARRAPERWGHLLLLERLGSGARSEVHRAWDPALQREVALKLMRPDAILGDAEAADAVLLDEGRALARLHHPNVVTVHGIDRHDGRVGLWMELVRGATLEQEVLSGGPRSAEDVARLGIELGSALAAVHGAGSLHRDIKPANLVRDPHGRPVLTDFGLGLHWSDAAASAPTPSGTPMYMAPELFDGAAPSVRSDLYALGLTLWFALAGRHPFAAGTLAELRAAAARGPAPSLHELRPRLPRGLVEILGRAIAPDPERRFASASELAKALRAWHAEARRPRPEWSRARGLGAAAGIAAIVLAAGLALRTERRLVTPAKDAPPVPAAPAAGTYAVEAWFVRRADGTARPLASGDRVAPGDRLSLDVRASVPTWVYVLNEDDRGERYVLFPQPLYDLQNPVPAESACVLPGPIGGRENAWTVTSAGGHERFLVVVSPEPVPEIEAELARLPAPSPGRPIRYASVDRTTVERLRGTGGLAQLPAEAAPAPARGSAFDRFRALAGRETGVRGVWVRQVVLENPAR
jgi:tRNA A-37 threonylcarbamoyl transferase component Bud32